MILYIYIALRQGQKTPWGQTFDVNRKPLSLRPFVANFKQISLNSDFIHILLMFFHTYIAPWQGQTTLRGRNPDVNRKALSLCTFVASFKNIDRTSVKLMSHLPKMTNLTKWKKWQKLPPGLNPNHMHIFKPWKKRCAKLHKGRHEIV